MNQGIRWSLKENQPARSAANNLIEGNHDESITFLDQLTGRDEPTKAAWRATKEQMMSRRKGKLQRGIIARILGGCIFYPNSSWEWLNILQFALYIFTLIRRSFQEIINRQNMLALPGDSLYSFPSFRHLLE